VREREGRGKREEKRTKREVEIERERERERNYAPTPNDCIKFQVQRAFAERYRLIEVRETEEKDTERETN
jgi:hypothetical protein